MSVVTKLKTRSVQSGSSWVILEKEDVAAWIAPVTKLEKALAMLKPFSSAKMVAYPVSSLVNNARHDGPECVARVS